LFIVIERQTENKEQQAVQKHYTNQAQKRGISEAGSPSHPQD
jgi:hypothetical protein